MPITRIDVQPRSVASIDAQEKLNGAKNKEKSAAIQQIEKTATVEAPKKEKTSAENTGLNVAVKPPVTIQQIAANDLDKATKNAGKGSVENVAQNSGFLDRIKSFFGFGPSVIKPTEKIDNEIDSFKRNNVVLSTRASLSNKNETTNLKDKLDGNESKLRTADTVTTGLGIVKSGLSSAGAVVSELASTAAKDTFAGVGLGFSLFAAAKSGKELRSAVKLDGEAEKILAKSPVERERDAIIGAKAEVKGEIDALKKQLNPNFVNADGKKLTDDQKTEIKGKIDTLQTELKGLDGKLKNVSEANTGKGTDTAVAERVKDTQNIGSKTLNFLKNLGSVALGVAGVALLAGAAVSGVGLIAAAGAFAVGGIALFAYKKYQQGKEKETEGKLTNQLDEVKSLKDQVNKSSASPEEKTKSLDTLNKIETKVTDELKKVSPKFLKESLLNDLNGDDRVAKVKASNLLKSGLFNFSDDQVKSLQFKNKGLTPEKEAEAKNKAFETLSLTLDVSK